ncbi:YciI family protein [Kitasatospora sp. NPDC051853]|uniref:YciI family protein n=1 Tax=Kitasatospora sp. NPDC051853 TaxID=3364058 RepID=UPI003790B4E8
MPRYMTLIRIDEEKAAGFEPDPGFEQRMGALFEELAKAGAMLDTNGLKPTSEGTRLSWSGGRLSLTDGPFTETREVVGGYIVLQCRDKAEAVEWTRRFLSLHPEGWEVGAEVREIDEMPTPPGA